MRLQTKIASVYSTGQIALRQRRAAMSSEGQIGTEQKGSGLAAVSTPWLGRHEPQIFERPLEIVFVPIRNQMWRHRRAEI